MLSNSLFLLRLRSGFATGLALILFSSVASTTPPTARADSSTTDNNSPHSTAIASEDLAAFDGAWSRVDSGNGDLDRMESIDSALEDLSWIVRRMASGVLKKSTSPPQDLAFSWDGQALHQVIDGEMGQFDRPVRFGGEPQKLTDNRGEDFTSIWRWTERGLEVHWTQSQAYGSNVYQLRENGSMDVEHRIHVTALDGIAPIVYGSTFRRIDLPTVSAAGTATAVAAEASELR